MRYVTVKITRDTQTASSSQVAPWEVPILEHLFEAGNVEIEEGSGTPADSRGYPEIGEEFGRLIKVYGSDTKSGIPYVVSVFGEGRRGIEALRDLIEEAEGDEQRAPKPKVKAARKARAVDLSDPLMA
jgi:hypothetical protein